MSEIHDYRHCSLCGAYLEPPDTLTAIKMEEAFRQHFPRTWKDEGRKLVCDPCADKLKLRHQFEADWDGDDGLFGVS